MDAFIKDDSLYINTEITEADKDPIKEKYVSRIKKRLGGSVVKLAITDDDIRDAVDEAIEVAKPYVVDVVKRTKVYAPCLDLSKDKIVEVLEVIPGSPTVTQVGQDEVMFDFQVFQPVDRIVDRVALVGSAVNPDVYIPFEFDDETQKLYINEGVSTGMITFTGVKDFDKISELHDERARQWIFSYALALCKEMEGRIRSKFKSSNIPIEFDGDTLLSEGLQSQSDLKLSLVSDTFGPMTILR